MGIGVLGISKQRQGYEMKYKSVLKGEQRDSIERVARLALKKASSQVRLSLFKEDRLGELTLVVGREALVDTIPDTIHFMLGKFLTPIEPNWVVYGWEENWTYPENDISLEIDTPSKDEYKLVIHNSDYFKKNRVTISQGIIDILEKRYGITNRRKLQFRG